MNLVTTSNIRLLFRNSVHPMLAPEQNEKFEKNKQTIDLTSKAQYSIPTTQSISLPKSKLTPSSPSLHIPNKFYNYKPGKTDPRFTPTKKIGSKFTPTKKIGSKYTNTSPTRNTVAFSLKDEESFIVGTKYNEQLIALLKQSPVWSYDPHTHNWTFPLNQYESLFTRISTNLQNHKIEPIPPTILSLLREKYDDNISLKNSDIPPELISSLLPYQVSGVQFCVARNGRAIIADEMGLGKTIQAIATACYFQLKWPLLVMCPSSLRFGWKEQLVRWVPWLDEDSVHTPISSAEISSDIMSIPVTVLSYDLVTKLSAIKFKKDVGNFSIVIVDESHFLKNSRSARTKAALPIMKKADHVLLLTGTPALSRPIELYPQISAVDKKFKMSISQFAKRYCNAFEGPFGWDYTGASHLPELQVYLNKRVMIRRNKSEVLDSLPTKSRKSILISLDESQKRALKSEISDMVQRPGGERYGCMLELFAKTASAKASAVCSYVMNLIQEEIELCNGEASNSHDAKKSKPFKVLVFFHHKTMLAELEQTLVSNGIGYVKIDGATTPAARQAACDLFQHGGPDECRVALLSLKAAGTGLTLTAARTVVFAELFWNPGDLRQAEDRAHRIGQSENVEIHYLVAQGSIDDTIWPLLQKKLDVLSQAGLANNSEKDSFGETSVMTEFFQTAENVWKESSQQRNIKDFLVPSPKRVKQEHSQTPSEVELIEEIEALDSVEVDDLMGGDWDD